MSDYVIVGDTEQYDECLVCICYTYDNANTVLHRMLTNPTDNDKRLIEGHNNLRIAAVPEEDCWWRRYGCD